jgi:PAS domain S-box-containing protein
VRHTRITLVAFVALAAAAATLPGAAIMLSAVDRVSGTVVAGLVVTVAFTLLAAAAVTTVFVAWPLRLVRGAVHRLAEFDFGARFASRNPTEIGEIMRGLDDLAGVYQSALEAARASERLHRRLYEHSPAGLFRTRFDGRVVECNAAALRMLGYDSEVDALTRHAATFYAKPAQREELLERLKKDHVLTNVRTRLRAKDGREIPALLTLVLTGEGGDVSVDGWFLDVTGWPDA